MSSAPLIAFGAVFVCASLGLSLVFSAALALGSPALRRRGAWAERRAATAVLVLPPVFALTLASALAMSSAVALWAGTDHCLEHDHHLHLCLRHSAAWLTHPWALSLVVSATTFVLIRSTLSLLAHYKAQRAAWHLRTVGVRLEQPACYLVPSDDRFAFTAGLVSPTVVVSTAAWDALQPEERQAILAHERAHVVHGDLWLRAALGFAGSFGFPLLVDRGLRLWELAAERIDGNAVLAVRRPSSVASALLALVQAAPSRLAPQGAAFAAVSHVPERIHSILDEEPDGERPSRLLVVVSFASAVSFAIACGVFAGPLHHTIESLLG